MAQKTLNLHLGKDGVDRFEDFLTEGAQSKLALPSTRVSDDSEFGDGARLYVLVGGEQTPKWLREVRTLLTSRAR